jgi:hypothetical protein
MGSTISLAELLEALAQARRPPDGGGFRVEEIAAATGRSIPHLRRLVRAGLDSGHLVRRIRYVEAINGRITPVTTYLPVSNGKASKGTAEAA